jgi:hypothetical protein
MPALATRQAELLFIFPVAEGQAFFPGGSMNQGGVARNRDPRQQ